MSQEAQPVELLYPPITRLPESSHSNGSFGPVFIVLAVIVVISAVACVLGRLWSRRLHRVKEAHHHHNHQPKASKKSQGLPKEWESRQKPSFNMRDGDIEFGFEKKIPLGKNGGKGKPTHHHNGGHKPEVRFADNV